SSSGVATSLSCADLSTGSSEDASEPGSPYSAYSQLSDTDPLTKMPPQILGSGSNAAGGPTAASPPSSSTTQAPAPTHHNNNSQMPHSNITTARLPSTTTIHRNGNPSLLPTLQWPWNTSLGSTSTAVPAAAANKNKRTAGGTGAGVGSGGADGGMTNTAGGAAAAKKARSEQLGASEASKRLKTAALEESQTKITGFFKSQMKPSPSGGKLSPQPGQQSNPANTLTANTPATTASLNKYFNILSQLKEQKQQQQQAANAASSPAPLSLTASVNSITPAVTNSPSLPVPALKKIERSTKQPAKIAQVAPNLRKTPSSCSSGSSSSSSSSPSNVSTTGKSPAKKHVAIAPRTPEMKQQQQGKATLAYRPPGVISVLKQKQISAPGPVAASPSSAPAPQTTTAPTNPTLYQLPVQLPNLVQLPPQLAAAANIMQLNNVAKAAVAAAANNNAAAQAAQAAAAQYFLNGTVFKLQQVTTATTTTATTATAAASAGNPFGLLSANELQEVLIKQQQQQHQMQLQQQQQQQAAVAAAAKGPGNSANFHELIQQQIVTQQQQLQRLPSSDQQQLQQQQLAQLLLSHQQQQHQLITATQPPPLAATNSNMNTANNSNNHIASNNLSNIQQQRAIVKPPMHSSTQPPPLVTISSAPACVTAATSASAPKRTVPTAKPYQKRLTTKSTSSKFASGVGSAPIIATPTTPPPLVPTSVTKELGQLRKSTERVQKESPAPPTPPLVSFAPSKLTPTLSLAKLGPAMKLSSSSPDLFDLVKNGAIGLGAKATQPLTPLPFSSPSSCSNSNSAMGNCLRSSPALSNSCTLSAFSKVKAEPNDMASQSCSIASLTISPASPKPQSFAGQLPKRNGDYDRNQDPEDESIKHQLLPECTNSNSNSNSCSSNSNYSHSVSSAADLSLEASTPAPSPSPSSSPSASPSALGSSSPTASNLSDSSRRAASQTDMLSELVTSSCISSGNEDCSQTTDSPPPTALPLQLGKDDATPPPTSSSNSSSDCSTYDDEDDKSVGSLETQRAQKRLRNLPTPESGIGGSLSNSESSNSIVDAMSSKSVGPPTTVISNSSVVSSSSSESNSLASNAPSPASPDDGSSNATAGSIPHTTVVNIALVESSINGLSKSAISPILSQPKTIRFPAGAGTGGKGGKRHDGVCYWNKCNKKHDSNSKLLDHMQTQHVNTQTGPFACLWVGCKVYNKESCSRRWLERHVLSHGGSKQFKCIVDGCGLRFGSQLALQKHVNNHFNAADNAKDSTSKRTSDPPVPKQLRKNGKKLRYRRQPFSARMFDFFDTGIMEGLQHRLRQISTLTNGAQAIEFQGQCLMRRRNSLGRYECFVRWSPREIISDEWLPECPNLVRKHTKVLYVKQMRPSEKTRVDSLLSTAFRLRYDAQLFADDYNLEEQEVGEAGDSECDEVGEEEEHEDEYEYDDDSAHSASCETVSSYQQVLSIAKLQMHQRHKHHRKPIKTSQATIQQLVSTDALVPI
ncbi:hypothetical protein KR009_009621, partial [Drosophila setifemur]